MDGPSRRQFSIGRLMCWIAAAGVLFALLRHLESLAAIVGVVGILLLYWVLLLRHTAWLVVAKPPLPPDAIGREPRAREGASRNEPQP